MKLQQLSYFCEVCKFNNISRAAEHLYISPSAISMAVKDIVYPYRLHIHYLQKILETCNENRMNVMKTDRDNVLCQFFITLWLKLRKQKETSVGETKHL